jgi:MFS family permease
MPSDENQEGKKKRAFAMHVIILLGVVSLLGDIIYEGARSVTGPYLALLGASAAIVGFISGLGEFIGYALRLVSGYLADKTERYWLMTFIGYGLLISIPLLAFAGRWEIAAILLISERMGKAIRSPSRDAILSHATKQVGRGWGFAIHEAMDQIGAIIGPLLFTLVFLLNGSYENGFALLLIPVVFMIAILFLAKRKVPSPAKLESEDVGKSNGEKRLPRIFWIYTAFIILAVAGFANFQLISYHLKTSSIVSDAELPLFYALAMGVDGLVALIIGKFYDKAGMRSLTLIPLLTIPIPFLAFTTSYSLVLLGVVLWGAVMGIHETIMRAAIADMSPVQRRGLAYGIFNTAYGASWLLGGTVMGLLYEISISWIALFAVIAQLVSLPLLYLMRKTPSGKT